MLEKRFWDETLDLMEFVDQTRYPLEARVYQYQDQEYPVWEQKYGKKNINAWLISTRELVRNETHSLPDLRASDGRYYIYGFTYDAEIRGKAQCELFRYLAHRRCNRNEWQYYDLSGNRR